MEQVVFGQRAGRDKPYDIAPDNTIASQQIANAQIRYVGSGAIGRKAKPGLVTKLFDWLF